MKEASDANKVPLYLKYLKKGAADDEIMADFFSALEELNISPYPAQEEAILEMMSNKNVILSTPTGSGKSLVAAAMHFKGLASGKKSYYTCPIKALVSEKFFALCEQFGPQNVGMMTGDASINKDALIICCTAEILANIALAGTKNAQIDYVIMDEFHYYSDAERGVAWQIPLLTLPHATFLLMSATIGSCEVIKKTLTEVTNKEVALITGIQRPVPLSFHYSENPLHETLAELIQSNKYPVYVVNFTQKECANQAQNAMSVNICSKEEKQKIDNAIAGFRFDTPFGKDIKRYLRHGVGIHHAGLLPKYRLLTEKLVQQGLLKIIMGTDTLGVGVNVPIRTVLFTKLCKFDGTKTGILSVRDFKQIAGRAGRKGFDNEGFVIAQAPEHVIENKRLENKYSVADKKRKKNVVKKEAPTKNYVHFDENTFLRLVNDPPEPLSSKFKINHGMILQALSSFEQNGNEGYRNIISMINICHESDKEKSKLRRRSATLFKSLVDAQILGIVKNINHGQRIVANETLQQDFSLHHTLSLYLIEALKVFDAKDLNYHLDVLSLIEAIEENPRAILERQVEQKKTEALASMKAEGLEYDARIEALEKIEYDKPLADFIYQSFNEFRTAHPWVDQENIHPKSIARNMFENGSTFNEYINEYGLARAEGLLLRYLSQVYKTVVQTVPENLKSEGVLDIIAYLRTMIARVDTSLIKEWESMFEEAEINNAENKKEQSLALYDPRVNQRVFVAKIRAELFYLVRMLAQKNYEEVLNSLKPNETIKWTLRDLEEKLEPFYENYSHLVADPRARNPELSRINKLSETHYEIEHTLLDDKEDNMWFLKAEIRLDEAYPENMPLLSLLEIGC